MRIFQSRLLWVCGFAVALSGCASTQPESGLAGVSAGVNGQAAEASPALASAEKLGTVETQATLSVASGNSVFFLRGSSVIDAAGEAVLREHAERLKAEPKLVVTLVGRTDPQGSHSFNLAVAEQRTAEVAKVLRSLGVAKAQIRRHSMGGEQQKRDCHTEECRKMLRRVDLVYPAPRPGSRPSKK